MIYSALFTGLPEILKYFIQYVQCSFMPHLMVNSPPQSKSDMKKFQRARNNQKPNNTKKKKSPSFNNLLFQCPFCGLAGKQIRVYY